MSTYNEIAPEVSGIVTRAQVVAYFDRVVEPPVIVEEPAATVEDIQTIANAYMDNMKGYNGIRALARAVGLSVDHVRSIRSEIAALHSAYLAQQAGEE